MKQKQQPLASIIMPCWNSGKYIEESIASALAQTYPNIELIIADDGSEDEATKTILQGLDDPRIRVLYLAHGGPAAARKAAIEAANGTYILPLDSDDLIDPPYLSEAIEILERDASVGLVSCNAEFFEAETGTWDLSHVTIAQMLANSSIHVTTVFRKADYERVGGYDPHLLMQEDWDLQLSILELGRRFVCLPKTYFHYRRRADGSSIMQQAGDVAQVCQNYDYVVSRHLPLYQAHTRAFAAILRKMLVKQTQTSSHLRRLVESRTGGRAVEKLSILIVTCNNLEQTKTCLSTLSNALPDLPVEIIVIDNGSTDGTREYLAQFEDVQVIERDDRIPAAAWNAGARQATGDVLLFAHNDVFFTKNCLRRMIAVLRETPDAGAVGVYTNRTRFCSIHGLAPYYDAAGIQAAADRIEREWAARTELMILDSPCLLVWREAYERIGGFDESYHAPGVGPVDASFRFHQKGYHLYCAGTYVHHNEDSFSINGIHAREAYLEQLPYFRKIWGTEPLYSTHERREMISEFDVHQRGLRVLDVGCACGANLLAIRAKNPSAQLYGIEINPRTASVARCFGEVTAEDVEKLDRPEWDGTFDVIIAGDVIEHLRDPWAALRHFHRLLKPGGLLLTSVPNVANIDNLLHMLEGRWDYADTGILDRTHVRFFTRATITEMLQDAGFTVQKVRKTHSREENQPSHQKLLKELLTLKETKLTYEDMMAFQWLLDAKKPEA